MIIELTLPLNKDKIYLAAWEIESNLWNEKENDILFFIDTIMKSYKANHNIDKNLFNHIIYNLEGKAYLFFDVQNRMNEYFDLMPVVRLIE